jgi:hypothetical protein
VTCAITPASSGDAARNGKTVQAAFVKGIETYLDIIAAHMGGDEQEARQRAIALFSGLVGAINPQFPTHPDGAGTDKRLIS